MNTIKIFNPFSAAFLFIVACSGSTSTPDQPPGSPNDTGNDEPTTVREALDFFGSCTAAACGEVPPSSKAKRPQCTPSSGSCGWSDPDPNATVSYRQCEDAACGTKPDPSVCPEGTTFKGAQCGSENEGPCVWRSACVPPRSTTPCPEPNGCGDEVPGIGIICKDGTTGGLECMQIGAKCGWQPSCE